MTAPGVQFAVVPSVPRTAIPTATDPWFVAGFTQFADDATALNVHALTPVKSLADFVARFGARLSYSPLYDCAEAYFAEGGQTLYVSRVYGLTPTGALNTSGGNDDHTTATDAQWLTALNAFPRSLGPGQVSMPGRTTSVSYTNQLDHAAANNRVALLDGADSATASVHTGVTTSLKSYINANVGSYWAPWAVGPGYIPGTTRTIPWSAIQAGLIARSDSSGLSQDDAAAGDNGISRWATTVSQPPWDDTTRDTLNQAGVNVARAIFGTVRAYGYRTLVDPTVSTTYLQLAGVRYLMAIQAKLKAAAERFVFKKIDGNQKLTTQFGAAMTEQLMPGFTDGSLYGTTPGEAFQVNVGPGVNTPALIAAGQLTAQVAVRISPNGELVVINVAKVATTQSL